MSGHNIAPRPKRSEVEGRGEVEVIKRQRTRQRTKQKENKKKQAEWAHSSDMWGSSRNSSSVAFAESLAILISCFRRLVFARAALRFVLIVGRSFHSGELSLVGVVHNVWRGIDPVHDGKFTSSVSEALWECFRDIWPINEGWSGVLDGFRGGPSSLVYCRGAESVVPVAV